MKTALPTIIAGTLFTMVNVASAQTDCQKLYGNVSYH